MANEKTIAGSAVGGYLCQEVSLGVLAAANLREWHEIDVQTWGDNGAKANIEKTKRQNVSRQNSRPTINGFDYVAGYTNLMRFANNQFALRSFLFAEYRNNGGIVNMAASDGTLTVDADGVLCLNSTAYTFTEGNGFIPGNWLALFSDDPTKRFDNEFFGRVKKVEAKKITFGRVSSFAIVGNDAGAGKSIEIHVGKFIRNEKDIDKIKCISFTEKRVFGDLGPGIHSEHIEGCVGNTFKITAPTEKTVTTELNYVAICDKNNTDDTDLADGTVIPYTPEDAFNTSSDIYQSMITVMNDDKVAPSAEQVFGIVTSSEFTINNNLTAAKGHTKVAGKAQPGGFSVTPGSFDVDGKITVYMDSVLTKEHIKDGTNVAYHLIACKANKGYIIDIADIVNGDGMVNVPAEQEVTIPLDAMASENYEGYTIGMVFFENLPDSAMPTTDCN